MPTSTTITPSLTISAVINFGFPTATIRISAVFVISLKFLVFEWQTVTVPFAFMRSCAIGLPTMLLLPTTTQFFPSISMLYSFNILIIPSGVHGTKQS